jgi:hypothetical protein
MAIHFDTNGDLEIVISFFDITERKLMEIEIVEEEKQADQQQSKTDSSQYES